MTTPLKYLIKDAIDSIPWENHLQPTLPAVAVSRVLHEPAILGGYRVPYQPWRYYFKSLFQFHNETVNVWTHLIGCLVIVHQLYGYFHEFDLHSATVLHILLAFGITCIIGLLTSAAAHLLHAKSPYVHYLAFMMDYIGATFCSFGTGICTFYGTPDSRFYDKFQTVFLPFITIASYGNFVNLAMAKIWYGHDPHNMNRKYMFLGGMSIMAVISISPFIPRYVSCYYDETCSMTSLNHLTLITVVFLLEAVAFAAHQPEKTWPGKFDIFGHGHQLFHVLIVVNHVLQMEAICEDYRRGVSARCEPSAGVLIIVMVVLYIVDACTLFFLARLIPASIKQAEKMSD